MLVSPWFSVGVGAGIILCAGIEIVQEIVLRLEPGRMSPPLKWTHFISAMGRRLGGLGVPHSRSWKVDHMCRAGSTTSTPARSSFRDSLYSSSGLGLADRGIGGRKSRKETSMDSVKRLDWRKLSAHFLLLSLTALILSSTAFGAQGGQGLPWEAPLTRLQQSLSGPVAGAIAVIALVAIGVVLVFGGEWNEFARRSVYAVCAIAFIVSAATLLAGLFQVGAAVV